MELKAKLVCAGLLMYWIALDSCTRRKRKKEGRKRERERERKRKRKRKREEADELGLMELAQGQAYIPLSCFCIGPP